MPDRDEGQWKRGFWLVPITIVAGIAIWLYYARSVVAPFTEIPVGGPPDSARSKLASYVRSAGFNADDSGFGAVLQFLSLKASIENPLSLEHIREKTTHVGRRHIEGLRHELDQGGLSPAVVLDMLLLMAKLHLYEGEFREAGAVLNKARIVVDQEPSLGYRLQRLIMLQGLAALRRGEIENCVECQGEGSCIFPLGPHAVHQHPAGSRLAVEYFTQYLQRDPANMGARWLLNLAYMTLGEYPERVPPQFVIPLSAFQSEFEIGRFRDIAPQLGLNRLNLAGGAIMDDFDNDGRLDIIETSWEAAASMTYHRNQGDGTFEDRTKAAGLENQLGGLYCVQGDYNNDGWLDIYICRGAWMFPQRPSLLRNNGDGTFTDVTREAGLLVAVDSQVAAWADYDNDGWLDLFFGGETVRSRLYHNQRDGTFKEVAVAAGVANEGAWCKGANWGDFDGDRWPDLYVSNLGSPNRLFRNNRNGTFTDVAAQLKVTEPFDGFSCWFWDYDNDGWLDIFATSYIRSLSDNIRSQLGQATAAETCRLYRNLGGRGFADVTAAAGLALAMAPMGSNFVDVDNDGYLDFYLGTGSPNYSLLVPNRMFKNVQGERFADITTSSGTGHLQKGHAIACGDWDRDGNVDIYAKLGGAAPGDRFRNVLFQNPGQGHHWLTVRIVGKKTNRAAIGARIKVTAPDSPATTIYRTITSGSSFGANTLQQTIGIGTATKIASLEVYWPTSDTTQVFTDVAIDQAIEVTEFASDYRRLEWPRIILPEQAARSINP
jgi:hypothetical protein